MQNKLINWYYKNKRDLPWRKTKDPYKIWISEIMLQQTTVEAVIPYFIRFMHRFPNISSLALSNEEEVYKYWEGLGYYRRAKHIYETAQIIHEQYHDEFPKNYKDILSLKGIGPYTAGAISSIAFNNEVAAIDGNALRIISRLYSIHDNIAINKTQKEITHIVDELIKGYDASSFNQGLMDLGATICRPLHPKCEICPLSDDCIAFKNNEQNVLPINIKNIKHHDIHYITGIITYKDKFLMQKNPKGLLENLYGFIQYETTDPYEYVSLFNEQYTTIHINEYIKDVKHVFTHKTWNMHIYHFILDKPIEHLYSLKEIESIPISTAHLKVLKAYLKHK
jgi:A/G-specific adenine glycosylase